MLEVSVLNCPEILDFLFVYLAMQATSLSFIPTGLKSLPHCIDTYNLDIFSLNTA